MIVKFAALLIGFGVLAAIARARLRRRSTVSSIPTTTAASSPVSIRAGVIYGPNNTSYRLTEDDKLWLARAILGEAGQNARGGAGVAWSMATNYLTKGPHGGPRFDRLPSFKDLLRAYCQPINPAWMDPNGAKCRARPEACTPNHIQRRRDMSTRSWEAIPESIRQLVEQFCAGMVLNPVPGSTDWAASRWSPNAVNIGGNWFGRRA